MNLFRRKKADVRHLESLEELLLEADTGASLCMEIMDALEEIGRKKKLETEDDLKNELKILLRPYLPEGTLNWDPEKLNIGLVLGVNGVGKTTGIAKMVRYYRKQGLEEILLAAGDTFRAAAVEQLKIQGERTGVRVIHHKQSGTGPAAVLFDALDAAVSRKTRLLLADTAGRMHTNENLLQELKKLDRVIQKKKPPESLYKKILVLDATTGQNALRQIEHFNEILSIDGIILSKYDSTAKGGLIPAIGKKYQIPFLFLGVGESLDDLIPFSADRYLEDLLA